MTLVHVWINSEGIYPPLPTGTYDMLYGSDLFFSKVGPHGGYSLFKQTSNDFYVIVGSVPTEVLVGYCLADPVKLPCIYGGGVAPSPDKRVPLIIHATQDFQIDSSISMYVTKHS